MSIDTAILLIVSVMGGLASLCLFFVGIVLRGLRGNIDSLFEKTNRNTERIVRLETHCDLAHDWEGA